MRTGIDPTVDYAFKRVFASPESGPLLIHFLNAVLDPEPSCRVVGIENISTVNDRMTADDKLTVVDLRVRDTLGRRIIIEMQLVVTQAFRERILYYGCRDYVGQLHEGADYSALMPTIVICIVQRALFPGDAGHHFRFRLIAEGCSEPFSDRIEIHTIELGKFSATQHQLASALDQWLFFLKNGEELDVRNLPEELDATEVHQAVEVLDMISQSERDRELYELELKRRRDMINRDELLKNHGREEGLEIGKVIGNIQTLSEILGESVPSDDGLQNLPLFDLKKQEVELRQRLRERQPSP